MKTKVVCYYRVSTQKQGLGIEAQKQAVQDYLNLHPELTPIAEFTETFSGKEKNRPEFKKAIELCKRSGATLLSAKLDRIGRGEFLYTLLGDNSINFIALDTNSGSELERAIRVGIAIEERKTISARTSSALKAKADLLRNAGERYANGDIEGANKFIELAEMKSRVKRGLGWWVERGFKLGYRRASESYTEAERAERARLRAKDANQDDANLNAKTAIEEYLREGGKQNYSAIANYLNENNYRTRRGKSGWKAQSVKNLMERFNL